MNRETQVAQIPDVRDDNVTEVLRAIKSVIQVREGHVGDELDQNVTLRDLKDIGIVRGGGFTLLSNGARVPVLITGSLPDGYDPATDYTTPPAPTGLTITSGMTSIYLEWNGAPIKNPSYTEIWRSSVDSLGTAVRIATTATNTYADAVGKTSQVYYYWIRFVSVANVTGPYNRTAGTIGGTGLVGGVDLSPLIITADKIASGAIDLGGAKVTGLLANANMAVISDPAKIADYIISNTKLADLAVTAGKIASGAVSLTKFASGIEPVSIATGTLPTTKTTEALAFGGKLYRWNGAAYTADVSTADLSGTILDAQIAGLAASKVTGQLTSSQIADLAAAKLTGQITNTQISDDAISTPKLAAGAITSAKIAANTITAGNIAAGAITATEIAAGTITSAKIAAGTIQASNIAAGTITGDRISANTITGSNIAADTITAAQIAAGAISASEIAAGAITAGKIATGAIIANDGVIANGAITNALIANAAIGSAQIADAAITSAKIGNLAVGNAAIQNGAITNAKIGDLAADKITTGNLTAAIGITTGRISGGVAADSYSPGSANFGTGFYLGLDSSTFKFYVGSYSKNILWDGSNLAIKGTISASNATFQGLTITDNSGNILLSSGGISYSVVNGLGSLATQNSVSAGQVSGLGSFATVNQINTGNVSTYIAAGAIQNAYIGNFISSANFDGVINSSGNITNYGSVGWAIGKAGTAVFNGGNFRSGSSPAISGTTMTGSGIVLNPNGTFALGNSSGNVTFNGSQLTLNGEVVATNNITNESVNIFKLARGASLPDYVRTYKGNVTPYVPLNEYMALQMDATALNNKISAVDYDAYRTYLPAGTYFYELSVPVKCDGSDTNDAAYTAIVENPPGGPPGSYQYVYVGTDGDGAPVYDYVYVPGSYTVISTCGVNVIGDWQTATIFGVGRFTLSTGTYISAAVKTTDSNPALRVVARSGFSTLILRIYRDGNA